MSQTRVIPIRIKKENAEYIDKKSEELGVSRGKVVEKMIEAYRSIETLCIWGEIEPEECCAQIEGMFRAGEIVINEGEIRCE